MIKLIIFDFDGVFTDNLVSTGSSGEELITCSKSDSLYLNIFKKNHPEINLLVLTSEVNQCVQNRLEKLKLEYKLNVSSKECEVKKQLDKRKILANEVVYVGNDLNDVNAMKLCGIPISIKGSPDEVLNISTYTTKNEGGKGAVREVLELLHNNILGKLYTSKDANIEERSADFPVAKIIGPREWGEEKLLVLSDGKYVMKSLMMKKGTAGDLQKHHLKDEAGYVVYGKIKVEFAEGDQLKTKFLKSGDVYHFPRGCVHKTSAMENTLIIECSTPHFNDRIRMEREFGLPESGGLPSTRLEDVSTKIY